MAKRQTFDINDRTFQTKAELKDFVKTILHKYELHKPIDAIDMEFLSELLKRHPAYERKKGSGIQEIVIKTDGNWGNTRGFYLQRTDGTETDFSYITCIDNEASRDPLKLFKKSARSAVKDQVIHHLSNYISRTKDSNDNVICQKSQLKICPEQATVDHIPPITFDKIVTDFIEFKKIVLAQIDHVGFGDKEYKQFKDENLRAEFANYHKSVAKLRVVSLQENLRQKKKNFEEQLQLKF